MKTKLLSRINSLLVLVLTAMGFSCCRFPLAYGPNPNTRSVVIDTEAGTVNGKQYDNKTQGCWKVTTKSTYTDRVVTEVEYRWDTEFGLVAAYEVSAYASSQAGIPVTYECVKAPEFKDSESCLANNPKE